MRPADRICEIVVSRFCEDLSWLTQFPRGFHPITIYDKSGGGPRQRIHLPGWSSADGPNGSALWPGAEPLPNVGCESQTHMHHIVEHWDTLAHVTAFISGDAPGHVPDIVERIVDDFKLGREYVPYGTLHSCDRDGFPHAPNLVELREGWELFYPGQPMPETFQWHGFGMYLVSRDRIQRWDRAHWAKARAWCVTKACSLGMERLYDTLFADDARLP